MYQRSHMNMPIGPRETELSPENATHKRDEAILRRPEARGGVSSPAAP